MFSSVLYDNIIPLDLSCLIHNGIHLVRHKHWVFDLDIQNMDDTDYKRVHAIQDYKCRNCLFHQYFGTFHEHSFYKNKIQTFCVCKYTVNSPKSSKLYWHLSRRKSIRSYFECAYKTNMHIANYCRLNLANNIELNPGPDNRLYVVDSSKRIAAPYIKK